MDERYERAGDQILPRREDAAHVLDRIAKPEIGGAGIAHAVGIERDESIRIARRKDARLFDPADLARVLPGLRLAADEEPDELEIGMARDRAQRVDADVSGGPLDHSMLHGVGE